MLVTAEGALGITLMGIYVLDSAHFLYIGDGIIPTRGLSLESVSFGWPFELGGRRPYIPNVFTPFWPELRIEWVRSGSVAHKPHEAAAEMIKHLRTVRPLGWI